MNSFRLLLALSLVIAVCHAAQANGNPPPCQLLEIAPDLPEPQPLRNGSAIGTRSTLRFVFSPTALRPMLAVRSPGTLLGPLETAREVAGALATSLEITGAALAPPVDLTKVSRAEFLRARFSAIDRAQSAATDAALQALQRSTSPSLKVLAPRALRRGDRADEERVIADGVNLLRDDLREARADYDLTETTLTAVVAISRRADSTRTSDVSLTTPLTQAEKDAISDLQSLFKAVDGLTLNTKALAELLEPLKTKLADLTKTIRDDGTPFAKLRAALSKGHTDLSKELDECFAPMLTDLSDASGHIDALVKLLATAPTGTAQLADGLTAGAATILSDLSALKTDWAAIDKQLPTLIVKIKAEAPECATEADALTVALKSWLAPIDAVGAEGEASLGVLRRLAGSFLHSRDWEKIREIVKSLEADLSGDDPITLDVPFADGELRSRDRLSVTAQVVVPGRAGVKGVTLQAFPSPICLEAWTMGQRWDRLISAAFYPLEKEEGKRGSWRPTVAVSYVSKWTSRKPNARKSDFLWGTGVGVSTLALDQDSDGGLEVGAAFTVSAFDDYLVAGYGFNLTENHPFWVVGLRVPFGGR